MKSYSFTAIDFETANHKRNSVCAVGLVRIEDGEIIDTYYSLVKPEPCEFHPFNVKIHGITKVDVEEAPTFDEVFKEIKEWIVDKIVIAHNISFEESVINALFNQYGIKQFPENYICSLYLSRINFNKKLDNYKLPTVYKHIFNKEINHHNALDDAKASAAIALHIMNDWQPPAIERMAESLYAKGTNFITNKKKSKSFTPSKILQEPEFENVRLLKGNHFAFTGSPLPYSKHEAAQLIVNLGGSVTAGVTKSTTHLVCGELPNGYEQGHITGKMKKALDLNASGNNIQITDANLFGKLVKIWMEKLARAVH